MVYRFTPQDSAFDEWCHSALKAWEGSTFREDPRVRIPGPWVRHLYQSKFLANSARGHADKESPVAGKRLLFLYPFLTIFSCTILLVTPTLSRAGTLRGVVIDPSGRPVRGARVIATGPATIRMKTATDTKGVFHFDLMPGRSYELQTLLEGFRAEPLSIELNGTEDREVLIQLQLSALTESVVVSAQQVDLPLSRTSGNVTVITAEELSNRQIETVAEALSLVPGLTVNTSGGRGSLTSVLSRGGESDFTLVLVNGVKANAFGGGFDFGHLQTTNIEQIEVIRNPQSALYGADAIGAVVQIITRHGGSNRVNGLIEGGSFSTKRLAFSSSGSIGSSNNWEWGAGAERLSTEGSTDLLPRINEEVTNDDYQNQTISLSGGWRDEHTLIRSDLSLTSNERGFPGPFGSDPGGTFEGINKISRGRNDNALWSLNMTKSLNQGLRQQFEFSFADLHGTFKTPFGSSSSITQRISGRAKTNLNLRPGIGLTVGAEFQRERAGNTFITGVDSQKIPVRRYAFGYFSEARLEPNRRWLITAGIRVERIHRGALEADPHALTPRPNLAANTVISTNPKLSATYFLRPPGNGAQSWTRVGVTAGTGIRTPNSFEIAFTDNPELKPERSRSVSIGIQQTLASGALVLEANNFYNDYDDLIVSVGPAFTNLSRFRTDNIANARAHGIEIAGAIRSTWGLEARATYTWLNTRVLQVDRGNGQAPPPFSVGDPLIRRPRQHGSVDISMSRGQFTAFLQLVSRGQWLDVDPTFGASGGLFNAPGHSRIRIGLGNKIGDKLEASVRVTNPFDRRYEDALGFPGISRSVIVGVKVAPRQ